MINGEVHHGCFETHNFPLFIKPMCPPEHVIGIHSVEVGYIPSWNPGAGGSTQCDIFQPACTLPTEDLDTLCMARDEQFCIFEDFRDTQCGQSPGNVIKVVYNCTKGKWKCLML